MYSIVPVLHPYKNKRDEQLITFQVIVDRIKVNLRTHFKVKANQFKKAKVINHILAEKYNYQISKQRLEIENKLLDAFKHKSSFNKGELDQIIKGKVATGESFESFTYSLIDQLNGKFSTGRINRYRTLINKVLAFNPRTRINEINGQWLQRFENYLRGTGILNSTILSNIKVVTAIVRAARNQHVISNFDFSGYENIKLSFIEPDFLNEDELSAFANVCREIEQRIIKVPGYYFLLSCYTGLRIGDALQFNCKTMIKNDEVVLYAHKNKKRSGVPLFSDLVEVLEFIKDNPCTYHQKTVRESVKKIALMAGIKKYVKFHASRHTFCSRMLQKGFTIPEVADMAGDTVQTISKVYAHVDMSALKKKVKELLG